ncbi:uncharacterized protein [Diabrotica undecimpunctata]|uniref:uncharacterized protein n=1 Tax=Diabrotica undecimpunctata TaxID=50387 RepID=UPI003B63BE6C
MDVITFLSISQRCIRLLRTGLRAFSAERPTATVVLIISFCVTVLPFVTATALMPLTIMLDLSNALSTKGVFYVMYSLFFQVSILMLVIVILFVFAFTIATFATIFHKYNIISK